MSSLNYPYKKLFIQIIEIQFLVKNLLKVLVDNHYQKHTFSFKKFYLYNQEGMNLRLKFKLIKTYSR